MKVNTATEHGESYLFKQTATRGPGLCTSHNSDDFLLFSANLAIVGTVAPKYHFIFYNRMKVCIVN